MGRKKKSSGAALSCLGCLGMMVLLGGGCFLMMETGLEIQRAEERRIAAMTPEERAAEEERKRKSQEDLAKWAEAAEERRKASIKPAPPYREIANNSADMTEVQWKQYAPTLKGNKVADWSGRVVEVNKTLTGRYEIWIDMDDSPIQVQDVYMPIDKDDALKWNKGDRIRFSGEIKDVTLAFGKLAVRLR